MKIRNRKSNEINDLNPFSIFLAQSISPVFYMKSVLPGHTVSPPSGFAAVIFKLQSYSIINTSDCNSPGKYRRNIN
jgi:hypothetical protein